MTPAANGTLAAEGGALAPHEASSLSDTELDAAQGGVGLWVLAGFGLGLAAGIAIGRALG